MNFPLPMWLAWSCPSPDCSDDVTLYDNVTNINTIADIFTGLMESNCTKPCNTTKAKTRFILLIIAKDFLKADIYCADLFTRSRVLAAVLWRSSLTPQCWSLSPTQSSRQQASWWQVKCDAYFIVKHESQSQNRSPNKLNPLTICYFW